MTIDQLSVDLVLDDSKFGPKLDSASGKTKQFGAIVGGLPGPLGQAASSVQGLASGFAGIGASTVVLAGAAAAIAGIGAAAVKVGLDWEAATATIRTGTGATGADLEALTASAQNVFSGVPESAGAAATAIADLNTRTGATGPALEALAAQSLNLARITGGDLAGTIATTTRVLGDWSIANEDATEANDFLFKTAQATGIGLEKLAGNVVQFGAPMRQLGFSFEESAALMGKFEKEGVNLETVMAGLRQGLAKLAKDGREPAVGLRETMEAIEAAGSAAEANGIAIEIFGARSGPDMAAAIREGRFEVGELVAALSGSSETINQAAQDALTLGEKFDILTGRVGLLLEPLGSGLVGAASAALDAVLGFGSEIGTVVDGVLAFVAELRETSPAFDDFLARTKAVADFLGGGLKLILDVIGNTFSWLAEKAAAVWNFFKTKGEQANKDLAKATDEAKTATKDLGTELGNVKTKAEAAERPTVNLARSSKDLERDLKASDKAARDAAKAYADLEPEARAAAAGVELFVSRANDSPVKIDGMAEAARRAAADLQAAHHAGELAAPTIAWVGSESSTAAPLVQGLADAAYNVSTNVGLAKSATDEWLASQNAANQKAIESAGALEDIGFEAGKLSKPGGENSLAQVSTVVTDLGKALVDTITGEGSFVKKAKTILSDFGKAILRDVVEGGLDKMLGSLKDLLNFDFGGLKDKLGGIFGAFGGAGGGGGGGGAGGGGGGSINPITGAISAGAGVVSAIYGIRQESSLNAIALHTLETANDLENLRRDQWQQHNEILAKWDIAIPTLWDSKDAVQRIAAAVEGGIVVSGYGGQAQQQSAEATRQGVEDAAPVVGQETANAAAGIPQRSRTGTGPQGTPAPSTILRSRTATPDTFGGLVMLPGDTSGLGGMAPGRSRTGTMQADPVYQDSISIMERNPLAVAAAQAGNVLASLVTGGLFFQPAEATTAAVEETAEAVENLTATVAAGNEGTQRVDDPETRAEIVVLRSRMDQLTSAIAALANRPINIEIDGRQLATVVGQELDGMQRALA